MTKSTHVHSQAAQDNSRFIPKVSLKTSRFEKLLTIEDWLQTHLHLDLNDFCAQVLEYFASVTQTFRAVLYVYDHKDEDYQVAAHFGVSANELIIKNLKQEDNIITEVVRVQKPKLFDTTHLGLTTTFAGIEIKVASIMIIPLVFNKQVSGVMELTYLNPLKKRQVFILENTSLKLAAVLNNLLDNNYKQQLLEKLYEQKASIEGAFQELQVTQIQLEEQKTATEIAFNQYKHTNNRLIESIKYARTIQKSLLPDPKRLLKLFAEYFVIYQAKDQVSGDFFWFSQCDFKKGDYFIMAVVDCTGHGVPGGFMSMIGNTLLHEIVNIKGESDPAQILTKLHRGIREVLKQETTRNHDGMEASICRFKYRKNQEEYDITYAGAKHDLYLRSQNVLRIIRGDRTFIGGGHLQKPHLTFINHHIVLQKNDLLYFSTDGLADVCNTRRRRYGTKRWQNVLEQSAEKKMYAQQYMILKDLLNFKQQGEQRDDITCIGIRI